jgi:indoleamine 2,3-dioxygenase
MSYAAAYTLYNYTFSNPSLSNPSYTHLRLIRAFERGLSPTSSEAGFVLTHVDMVAHSPALILGTTSLLATIATTPGDRASASSALHLLLDAMTKIESSMEDMWTRSRPADYASYRTFIFGITNQSMFPRGVVYEGHNDDEPMSFRGESGANDSIIPLLDALLEIPMPANPLTEILKDFRSYRPKPHREFLAHVREAARGLGVREYCTQSVEGDDPADDGTAVLYLRLLDTVRSFRWRHWLFAREYIIRRSKHPTATGGSPIVTWLPNQLFAVMDLMWEVWEGIGAEGQGRAGKGVQEMMEAVREQREKLDRDVKRWCRERGV